MRILLQLRPEDQAASEPGNPSACLLATALMRQYGGQWHVFRGSARRPGSILGLQQGWKARRAMRTFDSGGDACRGRTVTVALYGLTPCRRGTSWAGQRRRTRASVRVRMAMGTVPVAGLMALSDTGLIILACLSAALAAVIAAMAIAGRRASYRPQAARPVLIRRPAEVQCQGWPHAGRLNVPSAPACVPEPKPGAPVPVSKPAVTQGEVAHVRAGH